ncbi:MAG: gliding motility-associated C-terminal domain-containing protein, partial [Flavobacteriales bacterium]|nr:gliding motility-associated C-terminal domain-containing protein [Flavobacteriales bacterium]
ENYIVIHPKPDALFSVDNDVRTVIKPVFEFTDLSTENVTIWDWDFGDGTTGIEQNPIHTYDDIADTYPIVLMVETDFGCRDTVDYQVKVEPVFTFYIPSSFTPDNDGINDLFYGQGKDYTDYTFSIFDRWGELIFESSDDQYHWDGTFKGTQVQQGTYVYRFYIIDWKGDDHEYKGIVTLHR